MVIHNVGVGSIAQDLWGDSNGDNKCGKRRTGYFVPGSGVCMTPKCEK